MRPRVPRRCPCFTSGGSCSAPGSGWRSRDAMTRYLAAVMLTLAWGTLAFGAVYAWAYWPLAAACAAVGTWGVVRTRGWRSQRVRILLWPLAAVALVMALQLLPLPIGVMKALSPNADSFLAQFSLGYAFQPPGVHALSVVPSETLTTLALFL